MAGSMGEGEPGRIDAEFVRALALALGADRVDTSAVAREAYARDLSALGHLAFAAAAVPDAPGGPGAAASGGLRPPDVVARPRDVAGVQAVVRLAAARRAPVIPWGAGSGVCGGTFAPHGGVALDLKGLDRIGPFDPESQLVRVEAGVNGQLLEDWLAARGFTAGHFPSSITCTTVGGWVAARGAGQLSTRYGKVEDMLAGLEVVLASGELAATPVAPRAATGPDWNQVFCGSEGVLGVIVAVTLRVQRAPAVRWFRSWELPTLAPALDAVRELLQRGARPAAVRLYDPLDTLLVARAGDAPPLAEVPALGAGGAAGGPLDEAPLAPEWPGSAWSPRGLLAALRAARVDLGHAAEQALLARPALLNRLTGTIPGVGCLLLLTFEGDPALVAAEAGLADDVLRARGAVDRGPGPAETWWRNRLAVSFKQSAVYTGGGFVDTCEVATRWSRLLELHDRVREAVSPHALVMAHFSHAYLDGCSIYFTFAGPREDPAATRARHAAAWRAALDATVACGAVVSHHHGVGVLKADALRASHGPLHDALVRLKRALDPADVLNPGKLGIPRLGP